jgi:TolB-like protein/Flp pilus assembly protein TadD
MRAALAPGGTRNGSMSYGRRAREALAWFLHELRRRNILRAAALYATSVWALAQGITSLGPTLGAPNWLTRWFLIAAAIGFPFWLAFAWRYELTPQGIRRESEAPPSDAAARATSRRLDFWIIGVLAVAVVLLLTDRFMVRRETVVGGVVAIAEKSVAVLPLVNESGDPNALYFSDGLSEDLIAALSQFGGLKVIGRNSSFKFRNSTEASNVIAGKLGVAHLLEGSVRREGDMVRIYAELIDAHDGSTMWSQHYDRPYKDLFQLQDDITDAVAGVLKTKLLGGDNNAVAQNDRPPSGSLDAYNAYLQGKYFLARQNEADFRKAIDAFTTATRLDPRYAEAWADLSNAWSDLGQEFLSGVSAQAAYAQARAADNTALALAPDLANAHSAKGNLLLSADSNWTGAEAEFRRALQLQPSLAAAKGNLGAVLGTLGHPEQGADLTHQASVSDPLYAFWFDQLSRFLGMLGRFDEAEQAERKAIELQPKGESFYVQLSTIEILRGDPKAALAAAQQGPKGPWQDVGLALARQIGSDRATADAALKLVIDKYSDGAPYQIAEVYALRKDPDKTFEWLDKAWATRDPGIQLLLFDPLFRPYWTDPRFAAFCRKAGLPVPVVEGK